MSLPQSYLWLANEQGPRMIVEALKLFGTIEAPGKKDNPTIIKWAKEVGGKVADSNSFVLSALADWRQGMDWRMFGLNPALSHFAVQSVGTRYCQRWKRWCHLLAITHASGQFNKLIFHADPIT